MRRIVPILALFSLIITSLPLRGYGGDRPKEHGLNFSSQNTARTETFYKRLEDSRAAWRKQFGDRFKNLAPPPAQLDASHDQSSYQKDRRGMLLPQAAAPVDPQATRSMVPSAVQSTGAGKLQESRPAGARIQSLPDDSLIVLHDTKVNSEAYDSAGTEYFDGTTITPISENKLIVFWYGYDESDLVWKIRGQYIDSTGAPLGPRFLVEQGHIPYVKSGIAAVADAAGNVFVAWTGERVFVLKISASGVPSDPPVLVDSVSSTNGDAMFWINLYEPAIGVLGDGNVVVSWYGNGIESSIFDSSLHRIRYEFAVDSLRNPAVALPTVQDGQLPIVNYLLEPAASGAHAYTISSEPKGLTPISVDQGTSLPSLVSTGYPSSASVTIPLPFAFNTFNKAPADSITIFPNGMLRVGGRPSWDGPYSIPYPVPSITGIDNFIAPFCLTGQIAPTGSVRYQVTGSMPHRTLTVEWDHLTADYPADITCQVQIAESTNTIRFCYDLASYLTQPVGRVVGLEDAIDPSNILNYGEATPSLSTLEDGSLLLMYYGFPVSDAAGPRPVLHRMRPGSLVWEPAILVNSLSNIYNPYYGTITPCHGDTLALTWDTYEMGYTNRLYYQLMDTTGATIGPKFAIGEALFSPGTVSHTASLNASGKLVVAYNVYGFYYHVIFSSPEDISPRIVYSQDIYGTTDAIRGLASYACIDASGTVLQSLIAPNYVDGRHNAFLQTIESDSVVVASRRLNDYTFGIQRFSDFSSVFPDVDGNITVLWMSAARGGGGIWIGSVSLRKFDSHGAPLTDEILVAPITTSNVKGARRRSDGSLLVLWQDGDTLLSRRYNSELQPMYDAQELNTSPGIFGTTFSLATNSQGRSIVAWYNQSNASLCVRGLDSLDVPVAPTEAQYFVGLYNPSLTTVASLRNGTFAVGFGYGASYVQIFDAAFQPVGSVTNLPSVGTFYAITALPTGGFATVSQLYPYYYYYGVKYQTFDSAGTATGIARTFSDVGDNGYAQHYSLACDSAGYVAMVYPGPYFVDYNAPWCALFDPSGIMVGRTSIRTGDISSSGGYTYNAAFSGPDLVASWSSHAEGATDVWFDITKKQFNLQATLETSVAEDWNLISDPMADGNQVIGSVYPAASSKAFSYVPGSGYRSADTIQPFRGYWVKFPATGVSDITGYPPSSAVVPVKAGWNLIGGSMTNTSRYNIGYSPYELALSSFYGYSSGYFASDYIEPGRAYWVKANMDGNLYFYSGAQPKTDRRIQLLEGPDMTPPPPPGEEVSLAPKVPKEFSVGQNYPNPFNPSTVFTYALPSDSKVRLRVFNTLGVEIATVVDKEQPAGSYSFTWSPEHIASGIYFYKLEARGADGKHSYEQMKKLVYLK